VSANEPPRDRQLDDERIIRIETKIAHQEHTVADLNDVLTQQQSQIAQLEARVLALTERLRSLAEAMPADSPRDEKPPHY